jgi:2-dehydropantoate 2-reductase
MKVAIVGSGGIGGYFGSKLSLGGCDVHFIARGAHLAAMKSHGLKVASPLGDMHVAAPQATDDPRSVGFVDVVFFGVKLWDTEAAAESLKPLIGPETAVISFQNGVVKDEVLAAAAGRNAVAGGLCHIAAAVVGPGVIAHGGTAQKLVFGEYDGRSSKRIRRFHEACCRAGIDAEVRGDIARAIWEKFVLLVGLSATTASTRSSIGAIRSHPTTRRLLRAIMQEAADIGRAEGVEFATNFVQERMRFCDQLPECMTSSMLRDLEDGYRLEIPWLSGDVSRRGAKFGIPTPYNTAVADILALHADGLRSDSVSDTPERRTRESRSHHGCRVEVTK